MTQRHCFVVFFKGRPPSGLTSKILTEAIQRSSVSKTICIRVLLVQLTQHIHRIGIGDPRIFPAIDLAKADTQRSQREGKLDTIGVYSVFVKLAAEFDLMCMCLSCISPFCELPVVDTQ